jgi:hypothetical protein
MSRDIGDRCLGTSQCPVSAHRRHLSERLPETLTKRAAIKALWDVRGTVGDARKGATSGAVRTVVFTGHRTKKVIAAAEAQLGV